MKDKSDFCGPMNMGNPNEFTILELANLVISLTESESELLFEPLPEDDPKQRCPDITTAMKRYAWEPTIPLSQGIEATIEYFVGVLQSYKL